MTFRLLVTGGRDYADAAKVDECLSDIHARNQIDVLIHGGANGADTLCEQWARAHGITTERYGVTRADWKTHGKAAGPIRNQLMLDVGKPSMVLAFPGGNGTADMVRRATSGGFLIAWAKP